LPPANWLCLYNQAPGPLALPDIGFVLPTLLGGLIDHNFFPIKYLPR
jgi:hypothetical protein